eukprot:473485-Amphidinium_carterae.1
MEASSLYGLQRTQLDTAIRLARERERVVNMQASERFVHHVPEDVERQRRAREILLNVAPSEADFRVAARLGINTTTMHANIDPNEFPPVTEVSAPAFSGPPHKLEVETRDNSASAASTTRVSDANEPAMPKAMPKSPPPVILPSQPIPQYTSWISFNPTMVPDQQSPTMLMLTPESDWINTQIAMLKDGPKPWFLPHDYENAALRRAEAEVDSVEAALLAAPDAPELSPSTSLSQPRDDHENPLDDSIETGTVAKGLSPRDLNDVRVDEFAMDRPALEMHAAHQAANQAADGSAASASEGSTSSTAIAAALQRRAHQKITQKPTSVPMTPMRTVLEEPVPPSEPGSYRSTDEPDPVEEQSEHPPADE